MMKVARPVTLGLLAMIAPQWAAQETCDEACRASPPDDPALLQVHNTRMSHQSRPLVPDEEPQSDTKILQKALADLSSAELEEELQGYGLPTHGEHQKLVVDLHRHILADAGLEVQEMPFSSTYPVDNTTHAPPSTATTTSAPPAPPADDEEPELPNPNTPAPEYQVDCTCRATARNMYCVAWHWNLQQCYGSCSKECKRRGMKYQACNNYRTAHWLERMGYTYHKC